jgi:hypothetical protein
VVIGKDVKKREFEIPISVKDDVVTIGKAIDMDTNKPIDITTSASQLFEAPSKQTMDSRMLKTYDRYSKFFSGKPNDEKVSTLMKRFPSLSEDEAKLFLDEQYYTRRSSFYASVDNFKERIHKNRKNLILVGMGFTATVIFALYMKNQNEQPNQ